MNSKHRPAIDPRHGIARRHGVAYPLGRGRPMRGQTPSPRRRGRPWTAAASGAQPVGSLPAESTPPRFPSPSRFSTDGEPLPATVTSLPPSSIPCSSAAGAVGPTATADPPGSRVLPALPPRFADQDELVARNFRAVRARATVDAAAALPVPNCPAPANQRSPTRTVWQTCHQPDAQARTTGADRSAVPDQPRHRLRLSDARPLIVAAAQASVWIAEASSRGPRSSGFLRSCSASITSAMTAAAPISTRAS